MTHVTDTPLPVVTGAATRRPSTWTAASAGSVPVQADSGTAGRTPYAESGTHLPDALTAPILARTTT